MTAVDTPAEIATRTRRAIAEAENFTFESLEPHDFQSQTAAVLRVIADICDQVGGAYAGRALNDQAGGAFALMETFIDAANQAEYVATPCAVGACEPGGEPCTTHERLMAHAEGDHELCDHAPAA